MYVYPKGICTSMLAPLGVHHKEQGYISPARIVVTNGVKAFKLTLVFCYT